jgi:hypothetical protein
LIDGHENLGFFGWKEYTNAILCLGVTLGLEMEAIPSGRVSKVGDKSLEIKLTTELLLPD